MRGFKLFFRDAIWQILGVNYREILKKLDFTLLKSDRYSLRGVGTYDNGAKVWRWSKAPLTIGKYCSIAYDVNFIVDEGYHQASGITSYPFINDKNRSLYCLNIVQKEGIIIGNDVWIGMGAFIMPGVTVGNGVTIAANAVVTQDVPDFVVAAGSPAKIIRHKMTEDQKIKMNEIKWWDWPLEIIEANKLDFYELNVEEFIEKYAN